MGMGDMNTLRVGTFLAPVMLPVYQAITDALGAAMGLDAELVVETDYANCLRDVNDVCFVCSLPYVHFEREGPVPADPIAAPVLTGGSDDGRPIYFSDVIVRATNDAQRFEDLRGRSWRIKRRCLIPATASPDTTQ
jgi:phosphonate transport system substrate-binding protein